MTHGGWSKMERLGLHSSLLTGAALAPGAPNAVSYRLQLGWAVVVMDLSPDQTPDPGHGLP